MLLKTASTGAPVRDSTRTTNPDGCSLFRTLMRAFTNTPFKRVGKTGTLHVGF